jgi:hypothetical protein
MTLMTTTTMATATPMMMMMGDGIMMHHKRIVFVINIGLESEIKWFVEGEKYIRQKGVLFLHTIYI